MDIFKIKINDNDETLLSLNDSHNSTTDMIRTRNWPVLGMSLFSLFGVVGNILVCLTIKRDAKLQTKTNYYLFSLAITDLAVCAFVLPLAIIQDFFGSFFFTFLNSRFSYFVTKKFFFLFLLDKWIFSIFICRFWIFSGINFY